MNALDRLAVKLAQVQVKAYLKRSPTGQIEPVVAHERGVNPAAPPGITPLKPLGPPPPEATVSAKPAPKPKAKPKKGPAASFEAEPHERLKGLSGAWSGWADSKPWDKPSSQLDDPHLKVVGRRGGVKSAGGTSLGNIAGTWEGDHIKIGGESWDESEPDTRKFLLGHESSHAAAADILANVPQAERDAMLEPFKTTSGGYSESALYFKDDAFARGPEEMLADTGATILTYGEDILQKRFENEKQFDISPDPPNPKLVKLYATVAESLRRVGLLPEEVELARTWVGPYLRPGEHGIERVDAYWRTYEPAAPPRPSAPRRPSAPARGVPEPPTPPPAAPPIPPLPGEVPIPEGHVRLFHITPLRNLESVRENGLTMGSARGESYSEPNLIWGSAGVHSQQAKRVLSGELSDSDFAVIEFHADPTELDIGRFEDPKVMEERANDVTMLHDVPPGNIVAIHEPWHSSYRYLSEYRSQVAAGEYDYAAEGPGGENYARAINLIKQEEAAKGAPAAPAPARPVLDKEWRDYPKNWEPVPGDLGHKQEGQLPTDFLADIAMRNEPSLQTKREYEVGDRWPEFVADIRANGIQEPILVMVNDPRDAAKGRPAVQIEGHRRLLAARELGLSNVPVEVRYFGTTGAPGGPDLFVDAGLVREPPAAGLSPKEIQAHIDAEIARFKSEGMGPSPEGPPEALPERPKPEAPAPSPAEDIEKWNSWVFKAAHGEPGGYTDTFENFAAAYRNRALPVTMYGRTKEQTDQWVYTENYTDDELRQIYDRAHQPDQKPGWSPTPVGGYAYLPIPKRFRDKPELLEIQERHRHTVEVLTEPDANGNVLVSGHGEVSVVKYKSLQRRPFHMVFDPNEAPPYARVDGVVATESDRGRIYAVVSDGNVAVTPEVVEKAKRRLAQMIELNRKVEADLGMRNKWNGVLHIGIGAESKRRGASAVKHWQCSIGLDVQLLADSERGEFGTTEQEMEQTLIHELTHGMSAATGSNQFDYMGNAALEEGVAEGYTTALQQVALNGPDSLAYVGGDRTQLTGIAWHSYRRWVEGLEYVFLDSTADEEHPRGRDVSGQRTTAGERLEFFRDLVKTRLKGRDRKVRRISEKAGWFTSFEGQGLGTDMQFRRSRLSPDAIARDRKYGVRVYGEAASERSPMHDLIYTAETPNQARAIYPQIKNYLAADPPDAKPVARDAEGLVHLGTADGRPLATPFDPEKAAEYAATWEELPDTVYHVAPARLHDAIVSEGLQPQGHAWNFALSEMDRKEGGRWDPETQSYVGAGSDDFGWRPEAAYVFADPWMAAEFKKEYAERHGEEMEVFAVDSLALLRLPEAERPGVIKDPESIQSVRIDEAEQRKYGDEEVVPATPDEIFEQQRETEYSFENEDRVIDGRQWAITQVPPQFVRPVASYELKDREDWDEDDWTEYQEAHPEEFEEEEELEPPIVQGLGIATPDEDEVATLRKALDGYTIVMKGRAPGASAEGSGRSQDSLYQYLEAQDDQGNVVAEMTWSRPRIGEDYLSIYAIRVDPSHRGKGLATGLIAEAHAQTGFKIEHGGFSSPEGAQLGVFMASHYPDWNRLWLGVDESARDASGRFPSVYWKPGDPITGEESTFDSVDSLKVKRIPAAIKKGLKGAPAVEPERIEQGLKRDPEEHWEGVRPFDPGPQTLKERFLGPKKFGVINESFDPFAATKYLGTTTQHYQEWAMGLPKAQQKTLNDWRGWSVFSKVQSLLRQQPIPRSDSMSNMEVRPVRPSDVPQVTRTIQRLDQAIASAPPTPDEVVMHRAFVAAQFGDLKEGDVIRDAGFVSMATEPEGAHSYGSNVGAPEGSPPLPAIRAEILIPQGTRMAFPPLGGAHDYLGRPEIGWEGLLPRGSEFEVVEVVPNPRYRELPGAESPTLVRLVLRSVPETPPPIPTEPPSE